MECHIFWTRKSVLNNLKKWKSQKLLYVAHWNLQTKWPKGFVKIARKTLPPRSKEPLVRNGTTSFCKLLWLRDFNLAVSLVESHIMIMMPTWNQVQRVCSQQTGTVHASRNMVRKKAYNVRPVGLVYVGSIFFDSCTFISILWHLTICGVYEPSHPHIFLPGFRAWSKSWGCWVSPSKKRRASLISWMWITVPWRWRLDLDQ